MKVFLGIVVCYLCLHSTVSNESTTYRAAIVETPNSVDPGLYASLIRDAAKLNADVLILPSTGLSVSDVSFTGPDNYDEIIKTISEAARQGGLYVVAHLSEKMRCQNKNALIRSNLVFDRQGAIVSVYRKPVHNLANCTTAPTESTFTTDFGVTFGLLMEEDLVLRNIEELNNLKNFVVVGAWSSEVPFLTASQFSPSWAYITGANLISSNVIFAGKAGTTGVGSQIVVANLKKNGGSEPITLPAANPTKSFPGEDLSQYIIRPLDVEASFRGYTESVCHGKFCCEFYVKTKFLGSNRNEVSYGLAAFDGVRHFGRSHNIGLQNCAVFACAGLYKRTCSIGSENNSTNIHFDKIVISGNFTKRNSMQFPLIRSTENLTLENFKFESIAIRKSQKVTVEIVDSKNLLSFGIFGRDFGKDFEFFGNDDAEGLTLDIYDYLYNEDVQEFFDYVWIRLRILLVVVSIYVLEML